MKPRTALILTAASLVIAVMLVGTEDTSGLVDNATALAGVEDPAVQLTATEQVLSRAVPSDAAAYSDEWGDNDLPTEDEFNDPFINADDAAMQEQARFGNPGGDPYAESDFDDPYAEPDYNDSDPSRNSDDRRGARQMGNDVGPDGSEFDPSVIEGSREDADRVLGREFQRALN